MCTKCYCGYSRFIPTLSVHTHYQCACYMYIYRVIIKNWKCHIELISTPIDSFLLSMSTILTYCHLNTCVTCSKMVNILLSFTYSHIPSNSSTHFCMFWNMSVYKIISFRNFGHNLIWRVYEWNLFLYLVVVAFKIIYVTLIYYLAKSRINVMIYYKKFGQVFPWKLHSLI